MTDRRTIAATTRAELDAALASGRGTVGLVPTMGALHVGHRSLIHRARAENDRVVVSVFVNPTQFNDQSDLERYPRDLDADVAIAAAAGADIVYAPDVTTMYPEGFATTVHVRDITERLEGERRPGHFDGVATVVTLLLNHVRPDRSCFGEKDFQQLAMIRRMHTDLALPGVIVGCPIVRDHDGLALSSRNRRLGAEQRAAAPVIYRALQAMQMAVQHGERSALKLSLVGAIILKGEPLVAVDYLQVVDPRTLLPLDDLVPGARALVAATLGNVRLIDNVEVGMGGIHT